MVTIANNDNDLRVITNLLSEVFPFAHIVTAHSGVESDVVLQKEAPDIILLNLKVPDEAGIEIWKLIGSDQRLNQIPLIVITPSVVVAKRQAKFLNIKAEAFVSTPFDEYELKTLISALVQLKRSKETVSSEKSQLESLIKIRTQALEAELASRIETEKKLLMSNRELEKNRLASLNLLEDLRKEMDDRVQTESLLNQSEERLLTLIKVMPDIVCFKDSEGRWMVANEFMLNLFDLKGVNFQGKRDSEQAAHNLFYYDTFLNCEKTDEIAWANGVPTRIEEIIPRPGDTPLIFDTIKVPRFDSEGKRTGLVVVGRDITERKIVEKELQKLSQVVKQSPDSIIVTNTDGVIEYVNPATSSLSGFSEQELIGARPSIFSSGRNSNELYKELWETVLSGNEWKGEFYNKKKNGELFWEQASISSIKDSKGEVLHFLCIKEDITERKYSESIKQVLFNISKQAFETTDIEQLLGIVKSELNALIDTKNFFVAFYKKETGMLTSAYISDEKDTMESWPAAKSLTGYVIKNNKSLLLKRDDFHKLATKGEVELIGSAAEIWLGVPLTVDGKPYGAIVIQDYHNPNAFSENELKMLEFIASQVSVSIQRKKSIIDLEEALSKAEAGDKLKTAFINNISHEIRTPLNGILGFSEMILSPDSSQEDNELCYNVIKKSSKRLLNTVNSYMDISMIVSGTMEISKRPSNMDKLFDELYRDFKENCTQKGLQLILSKPKSEEVLVLKTDNEKLRKIVGHLLDNAVKFTQKGEIVFGYQLKNDSTEFFISDTGAGIRPEAINIIFNAFMSADVSTTRGYEGSGLGLTIANGMVKLLGGKIWVESDSGKGSTFYFALPFTENPVLTSRKNTEIPLANASEKPLILVAEDDDSNFKYIEIVLQYASFSVMRAENGYDAIEMCRNYSEIRVVLMDIKMPMLDGFQATKEIRAFRPDLPIIALTAHVTTEDENLAFASGCTDYITKPVSKMKLLEIINNSINLTYQTNI